MHRLMQQPATKTATLLASRLMPSRPSLSLLPEPSPSTRTMRSSSSCRRPLPDAHPRAARRPTRHFPRPARRVLPPSATPMRALDAFPRPARRAPRPAFAIARASARTTTALAFSANAENAPGTDRGTARGRVPPCARRPSGCTYSASAERELTRRMALRFHPATLARPRSHYRHVA